MSKFCKECGRRASCYVWHKDKKQYNCNDENKNNENNESNLTVDVGPHPDNKLFDSLYIV